VAVQAGTKTPHGPPCRMRIRETMRWTSTRNLPEPSAADTGMPVRLL
jgi:hypothetical protein